MHTNTTETRPKKVKTFRGWTIWTGIGTDNYAVFLPDLGPHEQCSPEMECGSLQECLDFIKDYGPIED